MAHTSNGHIFLMEIFARHDFDRNIYREAAATEALAREIGESVLADFQADDPAWAYAYELVVTPIRLYEAAFGA